MGQYIDEMDNLVEGLLEVIPNSFLLSSALIKMEIDKYQLNI